MIGGHMKKITIVIASVIVAGAIVAGAIIGIKSMRQVPIIGKLAVLSYAPQGAEVPIKVDGITVMFDKAVVPLGALDSGRDRAIPLTISPSVNGKFFWLGTHGFTFRPTAPLDPSTTYHVEMPPGIVSVDGYRLDEPLKWEFSTVSPRVLALSPRDGAMLLPKEGAISVRFNVMMDEGDVEKNLSFTDSASGELIQSGRELIWGDDGHTLRIQFKGELPWSSGLRLELPRGLKGKKGNIGILNPVVANFTTPDKTMAVERVTNSDFSEMSEDAPREVELFPGKKTFVNAGSSICYAFTQPVTKKSFENAFRIERDKGNNLDAKNKKSQLFFYFVDYESYDFLDAKGKHRELEGYKKGCVSFLEEYNKDYSFSLDSSEILALSGAALEGHGDSYVVHTHHAGADLKSLVTKNILSLKGPLRLPYRGINLSKVTVRMYRITDSSFYDEAIKNERVWELAPKTNPPMSLPLGNSGLKLPMDGFSMTIDQERMPADFVWQIPISAGPDVSEHFFVDLADVMAPPAPGVYLVEAIGSVSTSSKVKGPQRGVYTMIQITPAVLAIKRALDHTLIWATDIESGGPLEGVPIKVLFQEWDLDAGKNKILGEHGTATNDKGVAIVQSVPGEDVKVCAQVTDQMLASYSCENMHSLTHYRWGMKTGNTYYTYVYTDRPIYRPGQKVFFSSFVRAVREGRYFMPESKTQVVVTVRDAARQEIFKKENVPLESGGVVSGSFDLSDSDDIPRGNYTITIAVGSQKFSRTFVVASYRKPSFKVDLKAKELEIISGDELYMSAQGNYFFGAPMRKAPADWSIMTTTYAFTPEGYEDFSFIDDDLLYRRSVSGEDEYGEMSYESDFEFDIVADAGERYAEDDDQRDNPRGLSGGHGGDFFKDQKGEEISFMPDALDEKGVLLIKYKPDLKKYPTSQILTVEANVEDPAHQQVSSAEDVIVHKAEAYIGVKPEKWVYGEKQKAKVNIVSLDTKGKPVGSKSFQVDVVRREFSYIERRNAQGSWDFVYEPKDTKLKTIDSKTDSNGKAEILFDIPNGGEYRFVAKARDGRGNEFQSATTIFAWGEGYVPWRIDRPQELVLVPDKDSYKVGDTAKILVKSLVPVTKALMTFERGRLLEYQVIDLDGNASHIEVPITQGMIPNMYLSVVAHVGRDELRPPILFFGETELHIDAESKRLDVAIVTDRAGSVENPPIYRPGDEVKVSVSTKDAEGKPRKAHVIISVADESVLRLLNYQLPDLVKKFYYRRPDSITTSSSLISLKAGDAGSSGKKRRIFRDTAHFVANLITDERGNASFSFKLPDDLTTWVIEAVASAEPKSLSTFEAERKKAAPERLEGQSNLGRDLVLSDLSAVGSSRAKIMTTLPLVLRTALPRFAAWGDKVMGQVIANNRNPEVAEGKITVSASGDAVLAEGALSQEIAFKIPPGEEMSFPADLHVVSATGKFMLSAEAKDMEGEVLDSLTVGVPVLDRFAPEVVATSGMTNESEREQIDLPRDIVNDRGGLDVSFSASLALKASPSLKSLIYFPWGCSEQKSATLIALLLARDLTERLGEMYFDALAPISPDEVKGAGDLNAKKELLDTKIRDVAAELLNKFQNYDGGLRYWPEHGRSNFFASAQTLWALTEMRKSGFDVRDEVVQKLKKFVREKFADPAWTGDNPDAKAFGLWTLSISEKKEAELEDANNWDANGMSVSGISYLLLAMKNLGVEKGKRDLVAKLISLAKQEPRHISWPASRFFWSSASKNTALAAAALFANNEADPNVPRALAFLVNRKKVAPIASTQDNLYVSWFIVNYVKVMSEGDADFTARLLGGKKELLKVVFNQKNLLSQQSKGLSLKELQEFKTPLDLLIEKQGDGALYYDLALTYYLPPEKQPTREEGIIISREFYALDDEKEEKPLSEFKVGENYRGRITLVMPQQMNYAVVQDLLPAGFEAIDITLATSSRAAAMVATSTGPQKLPSYWQERFSGYDDVVLQETFSSDWGFHHQEVRDDSIVWSDEFVPPGVFTIRYPVRATTAGKYLMPGAMAFEFYEPEVFGRSRAMVVEIR